MRKCRSLRHFRVLQYTTKLRSLLRLRAHHSRRHGQSLSLSPGKNVRRTIIQSSLPSLPDATLAPALIRITNYPAPPPSRAEDQRPDANPRVSVSAEGRSRHFNRKTDPSLSRPCSALHCGRSIPLVVRDESTRRKKTNLARKKYLGRVQRNGWVSQMATFFPVDLESGSLSTC